MINSLGRKEAKYSQPKHTDHQKPAQCPIEHNLHLQNMRNSKMKAKTVKSCKSQLYQNMVPRRWTYEHKQCFFSIKVANKNQQFK